MGLSISNQLLGSTGLSVGLGLSRGNGLYFGGFGGGAPFTPAALFASGEQGVWYDPSDFSTLFQDSAGTIPVTAVEQPVGRMLDLSKGLVLGSELVTNGTFDSGATGWTATATVPGSVTPSVSGGVCTLTYVHGSSAAQFSQGVSVVAGQTYKITANETRVSGTVNGSISVRTTNDATTSSFIAGQSFNTGSDTTISFFYTAASTTTVYIGVYFFTTSSTITVDNISVQSIAGNHATQATSAARPTLSARVNLLTKTEQFDDVAWTKGPQASITANSIVAPDSTSTADLITATGTGVNCYVTIGVPQAIIVAATTRYTQSVYVKAGTATFFNLTMYDTVANGDRYWFNLSTGAVASTAVVGAGYTSPAASIQDVGNGWYRCTVSATTKAATTYVPFLAFTDADASLTLTSGRTGYIWGADLRVANDTALPVYQRVNTATDYDATGFPYYLRFDGTDDSMATASINFTATAQMSVFAGVRKLSDATLGIVIEASSSLGANNGSFYVAAPRTNATANYGFASKGTLTGEAQVSSGYAAPITNVVTGLGDISGDTAVLRINGLQAGSSATDQGTGNYGNYPLYIGRRESLTLPFNGRIYSLIVRGAATSETQIGQTEQWISNEMGGGYYPTGFDFLVTADGDQLTDASGNPLYTIPLYS